jgi:hypothetical protein
MVRQPGSDPTLATVSAAAITPAAPQSPGELTRRRCARMRVVRAVGLGAAVLAMAALVVWSLVFARSAP